MSTEENKKIVANAIKEISKEDQEKEIAKIKGIVKCYLERIKDKKEKEEEFRKERLALEKDLDDLKAGRLDKIEERQGKDSVHDKVTIIEIHRIKENYIPYQPWRSRWIVEWKINQPFYYSSGTSNIAIGGGNTLANYTSIAQAGSMSLQATGIQWQNFVGGSYQINGQNINL